MTIDQKKDRSIGLFLFIFTLALGLRGYLAAVNSQANDPHYEVIKIILNEHRIPSKEDAWEGFQPKLYHITVAVILYTLRVTDELSQIRISQFVNVVAGGVTIIYLYLFLSLLPFAEKTKLWVFALIALNPKFIGINAQATNDSFVILFSTLFLYYGIKFFNKFRLIDLILVTCFSILSALSKGNGIILFPIFIIVWVINIIRSKASDNKVSTKTNLIILAGFLISYLAIVPVLGQYKEKYYRYGSPFVVNINKSPLPYLFEKTYYGRPGITSIADSYFTFRLIDLIKNPVISSQSANIYPLHRTSLWTQLYGRFNFVQYDQWPESWQTNDQAIFNVGRVIYILALLPTLYLIIGVVKNLIFLFQPSKSDRTSYINLWLYILGMIGYLGFVILYSLQYRTFSTMKVIFIFPAFLCFIYFMADGMDTCYRKFKTKLSHSILDLSIAALLVLYFVDTCYLIHQLA